MKRPWLVIALLLPLSAAAPGAETKAAQVALPALLEAKGKDGRPIITPEQRAYFNSLNDRLRELLSGAVKNQVITRPEHLATILALELRPQKMELLLQDNCVLCHTDSEAQSPDQLFSLAPAAGGPAGHMSLKDLVADTHFRRGLSCAGCHGGDATAEMGHAFVKEWPASGRGTNRAWVAYFCARCHSDSAFMNRFNPALPTDQLEKFKTSPHGKLLLEAKDARAPDCISCHAVHGILPAKDPQSKVYARRVPETCGACHADPKRMAGFKLPDGSPLPTNQLEEYRASVHGAALLQRGDLGSPACNDCHGNHAALPPGISDVSRSCSLCHSANAGLFDGSKHRQAFERHNWPECGQCHGKHAIAKPQDAMLGTGPGSWCADCHRQFAKDNPECNATADFFLQSVTRMSDGLNRFGKVSEELAAKGLDVEPIDGQLKELFDSLKKSRTYIHSFSRNTFERVAAPGGETMRKLGALVTQARAEYRTRQLGLVGSIGLIGLVMLSLYLKLRQLER
ncbi:MAG TPA: cytochrome c3 family protein [Verrucomicrobiae bacterium]